jgi:hypothetical protein
MFWVFLIRRCRLRDTVNEMVDGGFLAQMSFVCAFRCYCHCDPSEPLLYRYPKVPVTS